MLDFNMINALLSFPENMNGKRQIHLVAPVRYHQMTGNYLILRQEMSSQVVDIPTKLPERLVIYLQMFNSAFKMLCNFTEWALMNVRILNYIPQHHQHFNHNLGLKLVYYPSASITYPALLANITKPPRIVACMLVVLHKCKWMILFYSSISVEKEPQKSKINQLKCLWIY